MKPIIDEKCELIDLYGFLGKKWSIALIHNISTKPITFNELNNKTKHRISSILLSNRLKDLIKFKLIKKEIVNDKLSYYLTKEGIKFKEILHNIKDWSISCDYSLPSKCKQNKCICDEIFIR